ncbi:MAG: ribonuclease R [Planctomycetaceae bacterium]
MSSMEENIKDLLSSDEYRPIVAQELARKLRVSKKSMPTFRETLDRLIAGGHVREGKKGRLRLRPSAGFISGVVKKIASGAGFVIPNERTPELKGADIYIAARDLRDAQTGDEVLVRLLNARRTNGQRTGAVEKVLERASNVFVGVYQEFGDQGYVQVDGTVFEQPIHVGDPGAKGALPDDKVVIEMLRFPTASRKGEAVLTEVLGKRGDPGVDTMTVIYSLGLPHEFSDDVLEDARIQAENFDETAIGSRRDLTGETIITIDPVDARDFDDAISLTKSDDGHWHLGVHIADVSHFVTPGSALDEEARLRGTSVYLPRHVIPMLPEVISNGLASLQQGVVRFTKSVFIEFAADGSVLGSEVANTAIKVARRFAYEEVMPIIQNPRQQAPGVTAKVRHLLEHMYELAMILRQRRFANGALQMGVAEVEIDFDKDGTVTGAHERHHDQSHEIIEEFMLAANIAVATLLSSKDIPFLRRVHGYPDELRLRAFQDFCRGLGYELEHFQSRSEIQSLINEVADKPEGRAINYALLRSMKQAEYSPEDAGHYALSEEDYCHFTSPIRRYPDLTVHRIIGDLADGRIPTTDSMAELLQLGKNCSSTERRAEKAERELIKIKLLRYMSAHVGEEMDAFITGVENFGMFCQGVKVPAEGLIHASALSDDFYQFDQSTRTLTGQRTKREFRLGDRVKVIIANVDIDRRQLDLRLADGKKPIGVPRSIRRNAAVETMVPEVSSTPSKSKFRGKFRDKVATAEVNPGGRAKSKVHPEGSPDAKKRHKPKGRPSAAKPKGKKSGGKGKSKKNRRN